VGVRVGAIGLGGLWALEIFFLDHSIFIDDTNTFQLHFLIA